MNILSGPRSHFIILAIFLVPACSRLPGGMEGGSSTPTSIETPPAAEVVAEPPPAPEAPLVVEVIANSYCSIDSPTPGSVHQLGTALPVWGWAFDRVTGNIPAEVSIRIQSAQPESTRTIRVERGSRPDVAEAFRQPMLENSGFGGEISLADMPAGTYTLTVLQNIGQSTYSCSNGSTFILQ